MAETFGLHIIFAFPTLDNPPRIRVIPDNTTLSVWKVISFHTQVVILSDLLSFFREIHFQPLTISHPLCEIYTIFTTLVWKPLTLTGRTQTRLYHTIGVKCIIRSHPGRGSLWPDPYNINHESGCEPLTTTDLWCEIEHMFTTWVSNPRTLKTKHSAWYYP